MCADDVLNSCLQRFIPFPLSPLLFVPAHSLFPPLLLFLILKEDEVRGTALREEVEKLHEERNMLLETIEDLKQSVEQTVTGPELDTKVTNDCIYVTDEHIYKQMW